MSPRFNSHCLFISQIKSLYFYTCLTQLTLLSLSLSIFVVCIAACTSAFFALLYPPNLQLQPTICSPILSLSLPGFSFWLFTVSLYIFDFIRSSVVAHKCMRAHTFVWPNCVKTCKYSMWKGICVKKWAKGRRVLNTSPTGTGTF